MREEQSISGIDHPIETRSIDSEHWTNARDRIRAIDAAVGEDIVYLPPSGDGRRERRDLLEAGGIALPVPSSEDTKSL